MGKREHRMTVYKAVEQAIENYKERLIRKAEKIGLWENFGQEEVRVLEDTYSDYQYTNLGVWEMIRAFDEWCMNYTGE